MYKYFTDLPLYRHPVLLTEEELKCPGQVLQAFGGFFTLGETKKILSQTIHTAITNDLQDQQEREIMVAFYEETMKLMEALYVWSGHAAPLPQEYISFATGAPPSPQSAAVPPEPPPTPAQ